MRVPGAGNMTAAADLCMRTFPGFAFGPRVPKALPLMKQIREVPKAI